MAGQGTRLKLAEKRVRGGKLDPGAPGRVLLASGCLDWPLEGSFRALASGTPVHLVPSWQVLYLVPAGSVKRDSTPPHTSVSPQDSRCNLLKKVIKLVG